MNHMVKVISASILLATPGLSFAGALTLDSIIDRSDIGAYKYTGWSTAAQDGGTDITFFMLLEVHCKFLKIQML